MKTYSTLITEFTQKINYLEHEIQDIKRTLGILWKNAGGCERCDGRGKIVSWDTFDVMDGSAAEFISCPDPKCTAKTLGKNPAINPDKYDRVTTFEPVFDVYMVILKPYELILEDARQEYFDASRQRRQIGVGQKVLFSKKKGQYELGIVAYLTSKKALVKGVDNWKDRSTDGTWVQIAYLDKVI